MENSWCELIVMDGCPSYWKLTVLVEDSRRTDLFACTVTVPSWPNSQLRRLLPERPWQIVREAVSLHLEG